MTDWYGSPAHAGIDPLSPALIAFTTRFPRTRGDRPIVCGTKIEYQLVPPHTRG